MGDVHIPKPTPTQMQQVGARVEELVASGHQFYASAVTGTPGGRLRRPTLFIIAALGTIIAIAADGVVGTVGGGLGIIAILLLSMTDNDVVPLG